MVGFDKSTYCNNVPVDETCSSPKAMLHTLFHILGRYHEHERVDRVRYIEVMERNIIQGIYNYTHHKNNLLCYLLIIRGHFRLETIKKKVKTQVKWSSG